ncbi:hypothetical protein [Amycolatopsis sulphurea]|uniref:hypothetical protein n=1 Tax=Amycolatopsis sulphurea TaxID=76022 RepID=UPI001B806F14|nr:hypothetical protein [Amycolatopsis sulphurea]
MEKMLGALPVVADYGRPLDLAGIIDRACPIRRYVAILTYGQVTEAVVANRLTSPAPLPRVAETFGIDPAALTGDRIARALDAIAPECDRIVGSVGAQAIAAFGMDVSRPHGDMTSISVYGAHEQTEDEFVAPLATPKTAARI